MIKRVLKSLVASCLCVCVCVCVAEVRTRYQRVRLQREKRLSPAPLTRSPPVRKALVFSTFNAFVFYLEVGLETPKKEQKLERKKFL